MTAKTTKKGYNNDKYKIDSFTIAFKYNIYINIRNNDSFIYINRS